MSYKPHGLGKSYITTTLDTNLSTEEKDNAGTLASEKVAKPCGWLLNNMQYIGSEKRTTPYYS